MQKKLLNFGYIRFFFVVLHTEMRICFHLLTELPIDMKQGKWILLLLSLVTTLVTWAQPITEQEAAERALQFISKSMPSSHAKSMIRATSPKMLEAVKVEAEKIYAFNVNGGGYVIASGDSRALPVLGYSVSGSIDWTDMPENMRAWLKGYDEAIATLGSSTDFADGNLLTADGKQTSSTRLARTAIEPMITTQWYQDAPYWNKIPLYDGDDPQKHGKNCLTGCVATAMAQIMKFHEWPKAETKAIPAYDQETYYDGKSKIWHIDELPPITFDWANIIDKYTIRDNVTGKKTVVGTEAQQDAVATLMRYCSQACEMELGTVSSATYNSTTPRAYYYMNYAPSVQLVNRAFWGIDEWEELIYSELSARRPVHYSGVESGSGHSFVCDGYDGDGMFHINWGWFGENDGYYVLSVLNPYYDASLGRATRLGFCRDQSAIVGIQPPSEGILPPPLGRVVLHGIKPKSDSAVVYEFIYLGGMSYPAPTQDYALGTIDAEGKLKPRFIGDPSDSIVYSGSNTMTVEIDTTSIQPGESLLLYPMMKFRHHPECDWQLYGSQEYYVNVGRTEDGKYYTIYTNPEVPKPNLTVVDLTLNPSISKPNETIELTLTIHNNDDTDFTDNLYITPDFYGDIDPADFATSKVKRYGDSMVAGAYIRAGQDAEVKFYMPLLMNGVVYLKVRTADYEYLKSYVVAIEAPTAVTTISADDSYTSDAPYYDLQGRRLNTSPVRPGVYIYKGKKVFFPFWR